MNDELAILLDNLVAMYTPAARWCMVAGCIRITGADTRAVRTIAQRIKAHGWGVPVETVTP